MFSLRFRSDLPPVILLEEKMFLDRLALALAERPRARPVRCTTACSAAARGHDTGAVERAYLLSQVIDTHFLGAA